MDAYFCDLALNFEIVFEVSTCVAIWQVPESCLAGSILDIIFEVSDSNGLIDESIDGPLHTLNITSNELPLAEGARYAIKHGRCVVSHVQLPREQGNVTIVACHTHYPDLQITIQVPIAYNISDMFYILFPMYY